MTRLIELRFVCLSNTAQQAWYGLRVWPRTKASRLNHAPGVFDNFVSYLLTLVKISLRVQPRVRVGGRYKVTWKRGACREG